MILLHLVVATLYAFAAWALWPALSSPEPESVRSELPTFRPNPGYAAWLVPMAVLFHAWLASRSIASSEGLDLSLDNALSVVAGLVAAIAWLSGLVRTLPEIGTVVLPVAGIASLLPGLITHPHRVPYAGEPWAALHVAVALIGYALFIIAALQALVLMGLEKRLRHHLPDVRADGVPPLLTLERFLFRLVTVGFVLLTLTVISGIFFSEELFGKPFTFTHKNVFAIISWFIFGGLLAGHYFRGWRGRTAVYWTLAGFTALMLAYIGSKAVLELILKRGLTSP
jgi:ABC-type uncharacterized transport system permease subunit